MGKEHDPEAIRMIEAIKNQRRGGGFNTVYIDQVFVGPKTNMVICPFCKMGFLFVFAEDRTFFYLDDYDDITSTLGLYCQCESCGCLINLIGSPKFFVYRSLQAKVG